MNDYLVRKASMEDVPFLSDTIIAAEKSNSGNLSFSSLFNLSEAEVKSLFIKMLNEEIDGCEFSVSSFLVVEYNLNVVAAMGAWIEAFNGNLPSSILKANLISYIFPKESMQFLKSKVPIINSLQIEREKNALQLEYSFVAEEHRGKGLYSALTHKLIEKAVIEYPGLKKIQFQVFRNTPQVIGFFQKQNYKIVKVYKSEHPEILTYLPHSEKLLMEKEL